MSTEIEELRSALSALLTECETVEDGPYPSTLEECRRVLGETGEEADYVKLDEQDQG